MEPRNKFLATLDQEEMDRLLAGIDESELRIDPKTVSRIQGRTMEAIRNERKTAGRRPWLRYAAAALAVTAGLSFMSPQVRATMRELFSFVPGVGAIQPKGQLYLASDVTVISGQEKLNGDPVILADEKGVQLNMQTFSVTDRDDRLTTLEDFQLAVNGRTLVLSPTGFTAGGGDYASYSLFFETSVKPGDLVRISQDSLGFAVEGRLEKLDSQSPADLPHGKAGDITAVAQPLKREEGWDIHLYAISDRVIPLSFSTSLEFDQPLLFKTADATYPVSLPTSYGTGFMPAMKIEGTPGEGELVIPSLSYTLDERVRYTFRIPADGETYAPETGFTLAGFDITVKRIYQDPENHDHIALDLSWSATDDTTLDLFWPEGESVGIETTENGMTLLLEKQAGLTGRRTITLTEPEFTIHQEVRIPLVLD